MKYIKTFSEINKSDVNIAGGKGASLGEMAQASIPVPPGFVILSTAFERFLEETDLDVEIDAILKTVNVEEMHTIENASEKIQSLIMNIDIDDQNNCMREIEEEIKSAFNTLNSKYVAVRSSATAEDGASAAWAGQLDTFLNTTEITLLSNVRRCWASLFTPRAIFYRFEKHVNAKVDNNVLDIAVAVVVQSMVASESAGIAFSVHPVTEDSNQIIIEAGYGLGDAIVSGEVTPDSYVVKKDPREIIDVNVQSESQVLDEKQILDLTELVIKIENHYGFPCDIEWAYANGQFYILQSRPITTLKTNNIAKSDLSLPNLEDFVSVYAGSGLTLIFMDICKYQYNEEINESIVISDLSESVVYNSKKSITKCAKRGKEMTLDFIMSKNELVLSKYNEAEKLLEILNSNQNVNLELTRKIIKCLGDLIKEYTYFDIQYSDGMMIDKSGTKMNDVAKYILENKNILRDKMNMPFFNNNGLLNTLLDKLALQFCISYEEIRYYLEENIYNLFSQVKLSGSEIKERRVGYMYIMNPGNPIDFYIGVSAENMMTVHKNYIIKEVVNSRNIVKGQVANIGQGKVVGVIKIIDKDYSNVDKLQHDMSAMNVGDIMVSKTTDPELLPAMHKAAAFITDTGGMLSHAAIVARELGKPCIVGTKIATQVLHDGDLVEVDAEAGVVRIIERAEEEKTN